LPGTRAAANDSAIGDSEARAVTAAEVGTRHIVLLKAARTLGRLVGGGELTEHDARNALIAASAPHVGIAGYTTGEVMRTIDDAIAYGKRVPRRIRSNI
jgi:hypothetical protein